MTSDRNSPPPNQDAGPALRRGLWFDEFTLGLTIESPGRTVTEADLVNFAGLSGDFTALHTDEEFARRTAFRRRIAHGMLVQSIATGLGVRSGLFEGTIAALAGMTIQWRAPVFPGDTIRLRLVVRELDPEPSKRSGKVFFDAQVYNQDEKLVSEGVWETLILRDRAALLAERKARSSRRQPETNPSETEA